MSLPNPVSAPENAEYALLFDGQFAAVTPHRTASSVVRQRRWRVAVDRRLAERLLRGAGIEAPARCATCTERQSADPDRLTRGPQAGRRAGQAIRTLPGPVRKRQGSRCLLGCPGVATGSPAARQAWKPPITSVALDRPRVCRDAAASDDEYPWSQQMIHLTWWPAASGIRAGLAGSQRHSRWLRSMIMAPGISPSARRWNSGRVSMRTAPSCTARSARTGSSRARPDLAWRSRSSMVGGVVWWHRARVRHRMFIAARSLRACHDLGLEVLARPGGTGAVSLCPWCRAPCGPG